MLIAAVISLRASSSGQVETGTGRGVQGFWFNHWRQTDPSVGDQLHQDNQVVPYTVSPIKNLRYKKGIANVSQGDECWIRVTTLSPSISDKLMNLWLPELPGEIEVAGIKWDVTGQTTSSDEHPWAGTAEYQQMPRNTFIQSVLPSIGT